MRCLYENLIADNFYRNHYFEVVVILVKYSTLNFYIHDLSSNFLVGSTDECMDTRLATVHQTYTSQILSAKSCAKYPQFSDFDYVQDQFVH